jgi:hypothetical protein
VRGPGDAGTERSKWRWTRNDVPMSLGNYSRIAAFSIDEYCFRKDAEKPAARIASSLS